MNLSEIEKTINEDHKSHSCPIHALIIKYMCILNAHIITNSHLKQKTNNKLEYWASWLDGWASDLECLGYNSGSPLLELKNLSQP